METDKAEGEGRVCLLSSGCQGWPLGVSQLWRRSLYHIKGASKEPLQQHFGPAWKNRACFDWSATFYCHRSADQQLAPASAIYCHCGSMRDAHTTYARTHACAESRDANVYVHTPTCTCARTHTNTDTHENPRAY